MRAKSFLAAVTILFATGAVHADDIPINQYTADEQFQPAVAADGLGNYTVTWTSDGQDGRSYGIFARRFDADGNPLGDEFQVNTNWDDSESNPAVAANAGGNAVISWTHSRDVSPYRQLVYGQRYDAAGAPVGGQQQQTSVIDRNEWRPSVGISTSGTYAVAHYARNRETSGNDTLGIFAARFDATGTQIGTDFQVNTHETNDQMYPDLAMAPGGQSVVVWQSEDQDGSNAGVYGQRFAADSTPSGSEFPVNQTTDYNQARPRVATDATGNFAVAWEGDGVGLYDDVFVRVFYADGSARTHELLVNQTTQWSQTSPDVAMRDDGTFLVVWEDWYEDPDRDIVGRWYDPDGNPLTDEFLISDPEWRPDSPSVAMGADGRAMVVWESSGQDGDYLGVFGAIVDVPEPSSAAMLLVAIAGTTISCMTRARRRRRR